MPCPALVTVAVFNAAALAADGPVARGAFALLQSTNDGTPSMAAILQSAAVGGYVVISVNEAMQTGSAIARTATLTYAAK
ncbi:hypothetical protein WHR41_09462 [Cladosporium halotolerans]|uniref:Uncharacterized protein n=1 Tax=Cladosporium halotolerans TaxID=1052096 RepID=A0AB34KAL4_9PEZI